MSDINKKYKKRLLTLLISSFVLFSLMQCFSDSGQGEDQSISTFYTQDILYVGGAGEGNYSKIQNAIDNASENDIIFVYSGIYYENLNIEYVLTLQGQSRNNTIIHGSNTGDIPCIRVKADNVIIKGFNIIWADWEYHEPGIEVFSKNVIITDNNISIHDKGIILFPSARNCYIEGNIFSNVHEGIYFWPPGTHYHTVINNIFRNNDIGMKIFSSTNNLILNNTFENHGFQSLLLRNAKNNEIIGNTFIDNSMGIIVEEQSNQNFIFHNNFINNLHPAFDSGENTWDEGSESGGNFWDDYDGADNDNDSYGDEPYSIVGGTNKDKFPMLQQDQWNIKPIQIIIENVDDCFINQVIQFNITIIGGVAPYNIEWEFGDSTISTIKNPTHVYTTPGLYQGLVSVIDSQSKSISENFSINSYDEDTQDPSVIINSPQPGIYINNQKLMSFNAFDFSIIIGEIPISIISTDAESYVVGLNISINNEFLIIISGDSYQENIELADSGFHILKVKAYDFAGNVDYKTLRFINIKQK